MADIFLVTLIFSIDKMMTIKFMKFVMIDFMKFVMDDFMIFVMDDFMKYVIGKTKTRGRPVQQRTPVLPNFQT